VRPLNLFEECVSDVSIEHQTESVNRKQHMISYTGLMNAALRDIVP